MENTSYSSSAKTEASKPWINVARLGQRIIHELGIHKDVSVLERWMSHRVAELMDRVELATDATIRESAAKECEELILKLWEKRNSWPSGGPLSPILPTLNRLFSEPDEYYHPFFESESNTSGVVGQLIKLHKREMRLFLSNPNLAVSKEAVEASAETLELLTNELDDDERRAIQFALIERLSENETVDPETQLGLNEEEVQDIFYQSKDSFERLAKDREELLQQILKIT